MLKIGYINVFVSDFNAALEFFTSTVGLDCNAADETFGYASFDAGTLRFAIAQTDQAELVGRHTGIGFITNDIDVEYQRLLEAGVAFEMPPTKQPWGGVLALFKDPDNNIYYLDPGDSGH